MASASCAVAHSACRLVSPSPATTLRSSFLSPPATALPIQISRSPPSTSAPLPTVRAFAEPPKQGAIGNFFARLTGALPVVGLVSRIASDEGGVGADRIHYAEFCRRVEKRLPQGAWMAVRDFEARFGKMARPGLVFLWCWIAAVGAGYVRRDAILLSARRMRASLDADYELGIFDQMLDDQSKVKTAQAAAAAVPVEARAEVALDAILDCCVGPPSQRQMDDDDWQLLLTILAGVFPTASVAALEDAVNARREASLPKKEEAEAEKEKSA
ncbi:hypothetical protein CLOM_g21608 [Closterium sp. NIES-68]|nr:hypothetical protein CLOM_g21608 [Closterium sp. NIES-68]GJP68629.1 hypothetical protein CLOP_g25304 [Closterium sp. NIES-67]